MIGNVMKAVLAGIAASIIIALVAAFALGALQQSSTEKYAVDYSVRLDTKSQ